MVSANRAYLGKAQDRLCIPIRFSIWQFLDRLLLGTRMLGRKSAGFVMYITFVFVRFGSRRSFKMSHR